MGLRFPCFWAGCRGWQLVGWLPWLPTSRAAFHVGIEGGQLPKDTMLQNALLAIARLDRQGEESAQLQKILCDMNAA